MNHYLNTTMEIKNPSDFKERFLTDATYSFCEICDKGWSEGYHNFLEVASLEEIKSLHKHTAFESARRKFYTAILLTSGTVHETIGFNTYTFSEGTLYFIPEYQLHTIHQWSEDVKGYHCIFDADYFLLCLKHQIKLNEFPFFQSEKPPFVQLTKPEKETVIKLFEKLKVEFCNRKTFNDDLLVRLYLNALLLETERMFKEQHNSNDENLSRKEQLVARFKRLVTKHLIEHKQITEYAQLLHINPHYLNDTVREITGKSASAYVHSQLMFEAKAYLIQTNNTIARISDELNFTEPSYFCRFFKKHAGKTPSGFRSIYRHHN
ncbi:hypothetical protein ATO12_20390 [Aquimarina atlantica]|uniref:HTH araC/xylS-type domain-containing protein n=1 Tax=Aquimarina atlantica TaxID=1317122 RepID=A0A023BTM0_9FLAO|nr:AraC family transcriptional regulator [Aquimarina atlantica]EZH73362.1 hypothetical protein ATO12_20390 [Aquimarina atlantica]